MTRAFYPGPSVAQHMRKESSVHPVLGAIVPGVNEWPDAFAGEVEAAIAAGLLAPDEAPAPKGTKSKKQNMAEPAEAAAPQKE